MILHHAMRIYRCKNNQRYHITDVAKGSMPIKDANVDRSAKYGNWYLLLPGGLELVATATARLFAVGILPGQHLNS